MFYRKHPAGSAETGRHLVRDEVNIVFCGKPCNPFEVINRIYDKSTCSLHQGFKDDAGDIFTILLEKIFERVGAFYGAAFPLSAERAPVTVWRGYLERRKTKRSECLLER
jgi:hypothetical protein